MLIRNSAIVLKKLIKSNFEYNSFDDFCERCPALPPTAVHDALIDLENHGYLKCVCSDEEVLRVFSTHSSRYFYQMQLANLKSFLFKSILTPIVVSALTTLITIYLKALI